MSIVRVGMSEDPRFAEGYEAIFGKKNNKSKANGGGAAGSSPAGRATAAAKRKTTTTKKSTAKNASAGLAKSTRKPAVKKSGKK